MKKTILFGNGLNYLSKNYIAWNTLLDKIKGENLFENGKLPNTMIYERGLIGNPISFDGLTKNEEAIKVEIAKMMSGFPSNSFYKDLLDIKAENYLTTNYDYAFIQDKVQIVHSITAVIPPRYYFVHEDFSPHNKEFLRLFYFNSK